MVSPSEIYSLTPCDYRMNHIYYVLSLQPVVGCVRMEVPLMKEPVHVAV